MKKLVYLFLASLISPSLFAQLTADAGGNQHLCVPTTGNQSVHIGGAPTAQGGTPPYTYEWSTIPSVIIVDGDMAVDSASFFNFENDQPNPTVLPLVSPLVCTVKVTDANQQVAYDTVTITFSDFLINNQTFEYVILPGDSAFLNKDPNIISRFAADQSELSFTWTPSGSLSNANLPTNFWAKPDTSTWYSSTAVDSYGCIATSKPYYHVKISGVGTKEINSLSLKTFPNPATESIHIQGLNKNELKDIQILDLQGKTVLKPTFKASEINIQSLKRGVYLLKITDTHGKTYQEKFIKE